MLLLHAVHNTAASIAYTDLVWCTCSTALSKRLEHLQNVAARVILRYCREASMHHLHVAGTRMAKTSKKKLTLKFILCVSGSSPLHLSTLLKPTSSVHGHNARSMFANCLSIPQTPSKFGCKSFSFQGHSRWNTLSPTMRGITHSLPPLHWQPEHSYCLKLSSIGPKLNLSACILTQHCTVRKMVRADQFSRSIDPPDKHSSRQKFHDSPIYNLVHVMPNSHYYAYYNDDFTLWLCNYHHSHPLYHYHVLVLLYWVK